MSNNLRKSFYLNNRTFIRQRPGDGKWQLFQKIKDPLVTDAEVKKHGPKTPDGKPMYHYTWIVTNVFRTRNEAFAYAEANA